MNRRTSRGPAVPTALTALTAAGLITATITSAAMADKDLVIGRIAGSSGSSFDDYGTVGGISAYAIGTTACNAGTELLSWRDSGTFADQHPVIAQNLYRLKDGRFEQIGISWLKHGFCAADSTVCGSCQNASGCDWLGLGCSDTYGAGLNGGFTYLGPRSEVNPVTGEFAWPHSSPSGNTTLRGRLQVEIGDVDPAQNPGAIYIAESQYITPDDAGTSFAHNNSSWRDAVVGSFSGGIWQMGCTGSTNAEAAAIFAWKVYQPAVKITEIDVPGDGRFIIAYDYTENPDGTWHYEYALMNLNSHRAAASVEIPCPESVEVTSIEFTDVFYHSGEPYDGTDWTATRDASGVRWETTPHATDPNANALRWGTLYNFRFDANSGPTAVEATVEMFLPGSPDSFVMNVRGPAPIECVNGPDLDGSGVVDVTDLVDLILNWGVCGDPGVCPADLNCDGEVDVSDLVAMILAWS